MHDVLGVEVPEPVGQAAMTTLMVLDAESINAGVSLQCEHVQQRNATTAAKIAEQLQREGLIDESWPAP